MKARKKLNSKKARGGGSNHATSPIGLVSSVKVEIYTTRNAPMGGACFGADTRGGRPACHAGLDLTKESCELQERSAKPTRCAGGKTFKETVGGKSQKRVTKYL